MKSYLVAALAVICPLAASAGGYVGVAVGNDVIEVPCYPEDRFHLCAVPPVDVHHPGYLPRTVPSHTRLYTGDTGFAITVTPNIVPYELAIRDAAAAAAGHCGQQASETVVARITSRERHSDQNLESWEFLGVCQ